MKHSRILAIGDLHVPYQRKHIIQDLRSFAKDYRPHRIIQIGDLVDQHTLSHFDAEPDAKGGSEELEESIELISQLGRVFPKLIWLVGNHESRAYKTMRRAGIPTAFHRSLQEVYKVPKGWQMADHVTIGGIMYFHGDGFTGQDGAMKAAIKYRRSVVMGHIHGWAGITYSRVSDQIFGFNVGACIDDRAWCFAYARAKADKSVPGIGTVTDGIPQFYPMS